MNQFELLIETDKEGSRADQGSRGKNEQFKHNNW